MRGCQTIASDPAVPPAGNAVQVIYAWHNGDGNNYEASYQTIARIVDRIDWLLDNSTNYDQHLRLSCTRTPNGTYADYARALVHPVQVNWTGNPTSTQSVRTDLRALGYTDTNRWYLVFTDFASDSNADPCFATGNCFAVVQHWDSGVAGHELFHTFGAGHAWSDEGGNQFCPDIMMCFGDWWLADGGFRTYYDPSETAASFNIDPYPTTQKWNMARSPALTAPVCCDTGASSDLLTAQERTVETGSLGAVPTGFASHGSGQIGITPSCGFSGVSCRYFDGRRSLQVNTSNGGPSGFRLSRRPNAVAGQSLKFYVRLRSDVSRNVGLYLRFYNSSGFEFQWVWTEVTLSSSWREYRLQTTVPTGTATVALSVNTTSAQSSFTFYADSLQLSNCASGCRPDA